MVKKTQKSRREFLKGAVAGGAAVIVAASGKAVAAAEQGEAPPTAETAKGYEETRHVQDYYASARH